MNESPNHAPQSPRDPEFYRQTLGEDAKYQEEILRRRPTIFFRPDDRTSPAHPRYWPGGSGEILYIGFITKYGSHARNQPPSYAPQRIPVRISMCVAKKISEISPEECSRAYAELTSPDEVLRWLRQKYPEEILTLESPITMYEITYEPDTERQK